jgi:SfnB family sulfur acquisition oxidoreductase
VRRQTGSPTTQQRSQQPAVWRRSFAEHAAERDRERRYPAVELDQLAASGLLGIIIPKRYGGPGVSYTTAAKAVAIVSGADASLGQLFVSSFTAIGYIEASGNEEQKRHFFGRILAGDRFGNASSEVGGKTPQSFITRVERIGDELVINGRKFYSTGALLSDLMSVVCVDETGQVVTVVVDTNADGLTIIDDWDGFGQRTTASGTTILENVRAPAGNVFKSAQRSPSALRASAIPFLTHAAIDYGIAEAAIGETVRYVRSKARPFGASGLDKASQDPHILSIMGELQARLHAAELILERAGRAMDAALAAPSPEAAGAASIAISEARLLTTEIALEASSRLFQLSGARSTSSSFGFDRYWRDARTHTTHDPVHWHAHAIGDYYLNDVIPAR